MTPVSICRKTLPEKHLWYHANTQFLLTQNYTSPHKN